MSRAFPEFVEEEGSGKITLSNPERYKKLDSGIFYEDVHSTTEGKDINSPKQLVTITYSLFTKDAILLRKSHFNSSLAEFANHFTFSADITEAVMGMHVTGQRTIIILPEIHDFGECRIIELAILKIEEEKIVDQVSSELKMVIVSSELGMATISPEVEIKNPKVATTLGAAPVIGNIVAATLGAASVILLLIHQKKFTPSMSLETVTLSPNLFVDEQKMYPPRNTDTYKTKPEVWCGVGPVKYKVMDEGEGEVITRYQQGCFQYQETGSGEALSFEGLPTELAEKLAPGHEEAMLGAILGMKLNGRTMILIPRVVSSLGENALVDLKLTAIKDINRRSRL